MKVAQSIKPVLNYFGLSKEAWAEWSTYDAETKRLTILSIFALIFLVAYFTGIVAIMVAFPFIPLAFLLVIVGAWFRETWW